MDINHTTHGTCGLHFHINKEYFGNNNEEIENNIDKLILFTEYYKDKLINFSRRSDFEYCHFLGDTRYLSEKERLNILKIKKEKKEVNRYMVVNTKNVKTVEFRLIRGTLNYKTFMASLEFIFSLAKVIISNEITDISWNKVINYESNVFLPEYCKSRGIKSDNKKMKDYSIDFLKEQNRIKSKIKNIKKEIIIKTYEMTLKIVKEVPSKYSELYDKVPKRYSAKIKPEILLKRYQDANALILSNQYLLDMISIDNGNDDNYNYKTFFRKANSIVYFIKEKKQLLKKINQIDKDFLKFISSRIADGDKLSKELDVDI